MSKEISIAKKLDSYVGSVMDNKTLKGFERAFLMASAISELRGMLDSEYMKPIMALQTTRLGFKTDKDLRKENGKYVKGDGYPVEIVREVVIEATLQGYEVCGNQFNIIGGNMYPTQSGLEAKLNKIPNFTWSVDTGVPSTNKEKGSAVFNSVTLNRQFIGTEKITEVVTIPMKIDMYTSVDAMIGKCKRKAYAILLSRITGETVIDGDVEDIDNLEPTQFKSLEQPENTKSKLDENGMAQAKESIKMSISTLEEIQEEYDLTNEQKEELSKIK
jgi:hypothetical protein